MSAPASLVKFAWLSIAAAIATITLKVVAWQITNSVGLLSDAAESVVNLVAAVVALIALTIAAKGPDHNHHFGHGKAEYFSAVVEGAMIFIAAIVIGFAAIRRILDPQPLGQIDIGLLISVAAALINGVVAVILTRAGRQHRSITLIADGKHLMTDVWTSGGILVGVGLVWLTEYTLLDPIVAILVGVNILVTGWRLVSVSISGLMDASLSEDANEQIRVLLRRFEVADQVGFHAIRTRESGATKFMECHLLVPGEWTVKRGHDKAEEVAAALHELYGELNVTIHLEPIEDPVSYADMDLRN